jgi:replicative DNA helicase
MESTLWRAIEKLEQPTPWEETGIERLNRKLDGGIGPGELMVIVARPSVGKNALALQFILHAARAGVGISLWSLKMSREQWARLAVSITSYVPMRSFRHGEVAAEQHAHIAAAAGELHPCRSI